MSSVNLREITFQNPLRSKPVRENFQDIETGINDNQSQIDNLTSAPAGNEVTNARDYHSVLRERLRSASKLQLNKVITGLEVTAQSTPDMTVAISTGEAIVNGVAVDQSSSSNTGTITAPSNKRWDIVAIGSDNIISVLSGNDSNDRALPTVTNAYRPLALIDLDSTTASITNSEITDISTQGCIADGKWYFDIQDAVDSLDDRSNSIERGEVIINKGEYYEEVDLSGISNVTLNFQNGAKLYRFDDSSYCIKSINTVGNETKGIQILNAQLYGNGKAGAIELLKFDYTDEFKIIGCRFDSNNSSTATYKNWVIDNADNFYLDNNLNLDNSGDIDYSTTDISNAIKFMEDGYYSGQVSFQGTTGNKAQMIKQGWSELTAMDNKFLRIDKDTAGNTGGTDSHNLNHSHTVDSHNHKWYNSERAGGVSTDKSYKSDGTEDDIAFKDWYQAEPDYVIESVASASASGSLSLDSYNNGEYDPVDFSIYTSKESPGTDNQLSSSTDNKPSYYSLIALIHR